jgi:hypothetical protein
MGGFFGGGGGSSVDLSSPPAIGNTTPNTGAFTTLSFAPPANTSGLTSSAYSLTGSNAQSQIDLSGTLNTTANPTLIKGNWTLTAAGNNTLLIDLQTGGTSRFKVDRYGSLTVDTFYGASSTQTWFFASSGQCSIRSNNYFGFSNSATNAAGTQDVQLFRDAASVLALRTGTTAQTFRIYNTYTDASNYERGFFRWNANVLEIGAEKAGTGSNRDFKILTSVGYATFSGYFLTSNLSATFETVMAGVGTAYSRLDSSGIRTRSSFSIGWVSGTNVALAADTALSRNAAGVVEVNNGTAGTFSDLIVRNFRMSAPTGVPTANNSTGTEGSIRWDADYIYICTATNTWKRVAIATWP